MAPVEALSWVPLQKVEQGAGGLWSRPVGGAVRGCCWGIFTMGADMVGMVAGDPWGVCEIERHVFQCIRMYYYTVAIQVPPGTSD